MKLGNRLEWMSENLKVPGYQPDFSKFVLHLPLRTADVAATGRLSEMYQEAVDHPAFDSFWRAISTKERIRKSASPCSRWGGGTTTSFRAIWRPSRHCTRLRG